MKNIVLISPFHYDNYGMRLLYAYLTKHNIPTHYINFKRMKQKATATLKNDYVEMHDFHDPVTDADVNTLLTELEKLNPALIGLGIQSPHIPIAKDLTKKIKARFDVPIIWGGSHPTIDPESCIPHTDIVCTGEGFDAMFELSSRILDGKSYDDVRNLWINRSGNIIRNESRPLITDLDALPFASYTSENKIYIDNGRVENNKNIDYFGFGFTDDPRRAFFQTMSSYGCPMKCSFCINCLPYDKFRRRSPQNVVEELAQAKERNKGLKMIFFWDNIFAINKQWCFEFAEHYKKKVNVPFFTYSHPVYTDPEIYRALREAGWSVTVMGIQSGSYRLRKELYDRPETNEKILEATKRLNDLRKIKAPRKYFRIYYDYVKNNPLEGKKDLAESLDLFLKFPKNFTFQAFNLSFFPNYPITKYFLEKSFISEEDIEGNLGTSASNWITTFDSKKEYRGFLRRHEYYYLLFSLAQFKLFPNFIVRLIERKKLFMNRLNVLYRICKIVRVIDLTIRPSNYSWTWEIFKIIPLKEKIRHRTLVRYK